MVIIFILVFYASMQSNLDIHNCLHCLHCYPL